MAIINLIIPMVEAERFTGGTLCLLEYSKGLRSRGHIVNLIPLLPSPRPKWFAGDIGWFPDDDISCGLPNSVKTLLSENLPLAIQLGCSLSYTREILRKQLPPADVTVATSCFSALPALLYGTGKRFYFAQHFEPYFGIDAEDPVLFEHEATLSYRLGLRQIANSTWLKNKLRQEIGLEAVLCNNAIDHSIFFGSPKREPLGKEVRVISYGGRDAQWKGMKEMAAGIRLARHRLPDVELKWQVYGPSVLASSNPIANYEPLGFLSSGALAAAYRHADILLSASWYESFPLFPLEAMACGLPVITTQLGTEEFAKPGVSAEVIEPRSPESIADALVRLIAQNTHRVSIAVQGNECSREFNWNASVGRMESILLG